MIDQLMVSACFLKGFTGACSCLERNSRCKVESERAELTKKNEEKRFRESCY